MQKDSLILGYTNGRARVWNLVSGEFRRSTSVDAAMEMLVDSEWVELPLWTMNTNRSQRTRFVSIRFAQWSETHQDAPSWFSGLHTWGVSKAFDAYLEKELALGTPSRTVSFGLEASLGAVSYCQNGQKAWEIGGLQTLARELCLIATLKRMVKPADHSSQEAKRDEAIDKTTVFYNAVLPTAVGPAYEDVDIRDLVQWYNHGDATIRHAARLLFDSRLSRMSDQKVMTFSDAQIHALPVHMEGSHVVKEDRSTESLQAMTVLGAIALSKYALLKPATLTDLAASILATLKNGPPRARVIAVDLAYQGFEIWQAYIDPADMLRSLFDLAVMKDDKQHQAGSQTPPHVLTAHARTAVLQLASSVGPLFISTVTVDIVTAETIPRRNAIMKLCVFIARKKPTVLLPSLPRLAEAVVKSLDPTRVKMRESIQQTATVILNELVGTFPSIDFASKVQKLAVGTQEGAVIM